MEKIKFDPPPPLSLREVLPVIYYTGKERGKGEGMLKGQHFSWMADERIVLSRQTNKKCTKGKAF